MTLLSANIQPKGHIRLVLSDMVTGEIQGEMEVDNIITTYGETSQFIGNAFNLGKSDLFGYSSYAEASNTICYINQRPVIENKGFDGAIQDATTVANGTSQGIVLTSQLDPNPDYIDYHTRINPDIVTRNIWTIGIGPSGQPNGLAATTITYASLVSPCVQLSTQVLDIYYRVQFASTAIAGTSVDVSVGKSFDKFMGYWFMFPTSVMFGNSQADALSYDGYAGGYTHGITTVPPNGMYFTSLTSFNNPVNDNTAGTGVTAFNSDALRLKLDYVISNSNAQNIGRIMGMTAISGAFGYQPHNSGILRYATTFAYAKFGSTGFQYKPIQSIFNHSASATQPFLDVSNLATGQGSLTINGSAWTGLSTTQWPDFYRIDIRGTGSVGTARYAFSRRNLTGFYGGNATSSNYTSAGMFAPFGFQSCFPSGHNHDAYTPFQEQYSDNVIVTFDQFGISLYDILNSKSVNFDTSTTPALPVSAVNGNIQQVAIDTLGNVWIADQASGLYLVANPLGSPTITDVIKAGNTKCYAVTRGSGTKVWAIFDVDGLAYTTNSGVAWTTVPFVLPGGNFTALSEVLLMRADINSAHDDVAVVVADPALNSGAFIGRQVFWWNSSTSLITTGPTYRVDTATNFFPITGGTYCSLRCSKTGSFWAIVADSWQAQICTPGLSTTVACYDGVHIGVAGQQNQQVVFWYDGYGNPYVHSGGPNFGYAALSELYNKDGIPFGTPETSAWQTSELYNYTGRVYGPFVTSGGISCNNFRILSVNEGLNGSTTNGYPFITHDPRNEQGTLWEDMVWRDYRWNGSAWVLGYNAPVTDTVASHVGTRHMFALESQTFTGRSYIDVSPMLTSGNFGTTTTFTAYINPLAKSGAAEPHVALFDVYDPAVSSRLALYWNIGGSVTLIAGTTNYTFGTTPANGSNYRVVLVVNGTAASLYINGVQLGVTQTIVAQTLANTGALAQAVVGSRSPLYSFVSDFFNGSITNVQFWNGAFNSADIAADALAPTGVLASPSPGGAAISKAVWSLTNSLAGLETKPTHLAAAVINDGITIAFNDGSSGNSFVTTDYYTFGVVDGVLKDNATTFTWDFPLLLKPNRPQTTFTNATNTNTVPSAASANITETATWSRYSYGTFNHAVYPGTFSNSYNNGIGPTTGYAAVASQTIAAGTDGYVQFVPPAGNLNSAFVGICGSGVFNVVSSDYQTYEHSVDFNSTGTYTIWESNVSKFTAPYTKGDIFQIKRTAGTVTYLQNAVVVYTSLNSSVGTKEVVVQPRQTGDGIINVQVNYSMPAGFMSVGSATSSTGIYDPTFRHIENSLNTMSFVLGGTPVTTSSIVTVTNLTMDQMVTMGAPAGGLLFNTAAGKLYFNAANYGNTLTGSVIEVTDV